MARLTPHLRLHLREAGPEDRAALEALLTVTGMGRQVRLSFERGPDYFAGAAVQAAGEPRVWAAFAGDQAVGIFAAGSRPVWRGGRIEPRRYLADLRIHPQWRGGTLLARGYRLLREQALQEGGWAQTLVLEDNPAALRLLTSRRAGLPEYRPAGEYRTWLMKGGLRVKVSGKPSAGALELQLRRATVADLPAMQRLYDERAAVRDFTPALDFSRLGLGLEGAQAAEWQDLGVADFLVASRGGELVGMLGLWDQRAFQRMRVSGYSPALAALRPLMNLGLALRRQVRLPRPGTALPLLKLTAVAIRGDEPEILRALLQRALAETPGKILLAGLSAADPLAGAFHGIPARQDRGRHFLVGFEGEPPEWEEPFCFDVARI